MKYSVTNDKRNSIECIIYLISCLFCAILEIFILSKITFSNQIVNTFWIVLQITFSISPFFLVSLSKRVLNKILMKICNIQNLSGKYEVIIKSNYKKCTISHAVLDIKHSFDYIKIYFLADNSKSHGISAHVDNSGVYNVLSYLYINEGNGVDKNNKTHTGTAIITFIDNKVDGYFYNNGKDRNTYGTLKSDINNH